MLKGIKVIDFSRIVAGPLCSDVLSNLGADIIKVESIKGDQLRNYGPPFINNISTYFLTVNIGKKSLALNFDNHPNDSKNILYDLIKKSDIFLHNFPFKKSTEFGVDYESLKKINTKLIHGSVTGYGEIGELAEKTCFDIISQADTGIMNLNQDKFGNPKKFPTAIVDKFTGLYLSNGILAALYNREKTGKGEKIAVNLFECGINLLNNYNYGFLNTLEKPILNVNKHTSIVPYGVYRCKNNEFILMGIGTDKLFKDFCQIFNINIFLEYNSNKKRVLNREKLEKIVEDLLRKFSLEDIVEKFKSKNIPYSKVMEYNQALLSDHSKAIGLVREKYQNENKFVYLKDPLNIGDNSFERNFYISEIPGSNSEEILKEFLGYDKDKLIYLKNKGVI